MFKYQWIILWIGCLITLGLNAEPSNNNAVVGLLKESRDEYAQKHYEQSAALLERALRIEPRNSILWHDLAGVRLEQEEWRKAMSLAARSNEFAGDNKWLRIRNWTIISLACKGLKDNNCVKDAQSRAQILANTVNNSTNK
jgi:tetratricopeptide (TPR) repeat protein